MNKKFTPVRYFYLAMAALLFASLAFSTTAPSPTSAIDLTLRFPDKPEMA